MKQIETKYAAMLHVKDQEGYTKATKEAAACKLFAKLYKDFKEGATLPLFSCSYSFNLSPLYISENMSGKMEGILSASTCCLCNGNCRLNRSLPINENGNGCICADCFAVDTQNNYLSLLDHTVYNTAILASQILPREMFPHFYSVDIFRLESFGDLVNKIQAINYLLFAYENPNTTFTIWTKNPDILDAAIQEYGKPENLICIVSSKYKNEIAEANYSWIDHIFTVWDNREKAEAAGVQINCRAIVNGVEVDKCRKCMRCYTKGNKDFYIHELLK